MTKVIGMLVALAMFCAMPAVAFAGDSGGSGGDNVSSGNTQNGTIDQGAAGGDGGDGGSGDDDGDAGDGGDGGDAGNQAAICQQNAGGDANCEIDQSQNFGGDTVVDGDEDGDDSDHSDDDGDHSDDDDSDHSDDGDDDSDAIGGGSVESVELAQTGFDAWVLALVGGLSLAGGLGLLAAQRRGRLNA